MTEPADIVARILSEGGAIHPDVAPKGLAGGLVVVGVDDNLWKLEHVRLSEYFKENPRAPALETSRRVLWSRTQLQLAERWTARGMPAFVEDGVDGRAYDLLDEVWRQNREGLRLEEFPRALKKYRSAMLTYLGKETT
ncbi:MAG: hypothetical protein ACRD1X_22125 [Vicinamibacteria bacterium]